MGWIVMSLNLQKFDMSFLLHQQHQQRIWGSEVNTHECTPPRESTVLLQDTIRPIESSPSSRPDGTKTHTGRVRRLPARKRPYLDRNKYLSNRIEASKKSPGHVDHEKQPMPLKICKHMKTGLVRLATCSRYRLSDAGF